MLLCVEFMLVLNEVKFMLTLCHRVHGEKGNIGSNPIQLKQIVNLVDKVPNSPCIIFSFLFPYDLISTIAQFKCLFYSIKLLIE